MSASTARAEGGFTPLQMRAVAFCFALNMLSGASVLAVSYAAPLLAAAWGVDSEAMGGVFAAGLAGMAVGAAALGPLADRLGRKTLILAALALVTTGMAASSLATGAGLLAGVRVWVGVGIGASLAGVTSLASEHAPPRFRSLAVTAATAGYPLGATATAFAANAILPAHGWPGLFLAVAGAAAALLPLCLAGLPESAELARLRAGAPGGPSPLRLAGREHRAATLLLTAAFTAAFTTVYFLVSWIPTLAVEAGLPVERAIYAGAAYHAGSLAGHVLLGWLASRIRLATAAAGFLAAAALVMPAVGAAHEPASLFFGEIFVLGALALGGFGGLYAAAAQAYPAELRATGVGWALGVGRIGAVLAPLAGGALIGLGAGVAGSFLAFSLPLALAGLAVAGVGARAAVRPSTAETSHL